MFSGDDSNVRKFNTINRRVFILSLAKGIVFTGILARLFTLQISDNKKYLTLSDKNRSGDHICYYTNLAKLKSDYPEWDISVSQDEIVDEIVMSK